MINYHPSSPIKNVTHQALKQRKIKDFIIETDKNLNIESRKNELKEYVTTHEDALPERAKNYIITAIDDPITTMASLGIS